MFDVQVQYQDALEEAHHYLHCVDPNLSGDALKRKAKTTAIDTLAAALDVMPWGEYENRSVAGLSSTYNITAAQIMNQIHTAMVVHKVEYALKQGMIKTGKIVPNYRQIRQKNLRLLRRGFA